MADDDTLWMDVALAEAAKGLGLTAPNPPVGAVVVRDGVELGRGWHHRAGLPHAEREALAAAAARHGPDALRGATLYVTLEPCSTRGRTPPCTEAIVSAGLARVVYGATDPNPAHAGQAAPVLQAAGIEVAVGCRETQCRRLLRGFARAVALRRPWVIAKTAQSLDGRITRPPGEGQWLSSDASRADVQVLRSTVDAILTSGETLRRDDPSLTLRIPHPHGDKDPLRRIVVTASGNLPPAAKVFTDPHAARTLVARIGPGGRPPGLPDAVGFLAVAGWPELLAHLVGLGVHRLLVEAGGRLLRSLQDARLVDEWISYVCPVLVGGGSTALGGPDSPPPPFSVRLAEVECTPIGTDLRVRGVVHRPAVFFDRDGVVNDPGEHYYVTRWEDFHFQPGILEALHAARNAGFALVLVTSQRGVGKGLMTEADLADIHERMQQALKSAGCAFDALYAYTGEAADGPGAKPDPHFVLRAAAELGLDLTTSWVVGDSDRDIEMGRRAGLRTLRITRGKPCGATADVTLPDVAGLAEVLRERLRG